MQTFNFVVLLRIEIQEQHLDVQVPTRYSLCQFAAIKKQDLGKQVPSESLPDQVSHSPPLLSTDHVSTSLTQSSRKIRGSNTVLSKYLKQYRTTNCPQR